MPSTTSQIHISFLIMTELFQIRNFLISHHVDHEHFSLAVRLIQLPAASGNGPNRTLAWATDAAMQLPQYLTGKTRP
jgi:hypothetical protein